MERIDKILAHPEFQVYMRRIREQERTRVFCLHGIEHSLDVARIGYIKNLEQGLSFRQDVIYAMALLHDIGRCEEYASGNPIMRREPSWHDLSFWHVDIQSMNVLKSVMQSADIRHRVSRQDRLQHCCMMRISSLETVLTAPCRNSVTGQRKRRTIQFDIKFHIQEECSREKNGCFFVYDGCKEIDKKQNLIKTTAN